MSADSAIAKCCALLMARGTPTATVLAVERRLRAMVENGLPCACEVDLPEHGLRVTLPRTIARRRYTQTARLLRN